MSYCRCAKARSDQKQTNYWQQSSRARCTASEGYACHLTSQKIRKRIEEFFGWAKTVGGLRKSRFAGRDRTGLAFTLVAGAYNLVRMMSIFGWKGRPV